MEAEVEVEGKGREGQGGAGLVGLVDLAPEFGCRFGGQLG